MKSIYQICQARIIEKYERIWCKGTAEKYYFIFAEYKIGFLLKGLHKGKKNIKKGYKQLKLLGYYDNKSSGDTKAYLRTCSVNFILIY